ncbi:MAG: hypothetical protein ICV73_14545, partial [Acetobacteraceae bacterium]|nr:hypothetical protein [Acetobacteraceae bacterium]
SLTLQYNKVLFLLEPSEFARGLARRRVTVLDHPDGRLEIRFRGRALPYTTFEKLRHVPRQAPVVERRNLDAALCAVRAQQGDREGRGTTGPAAVVPSVPPATAGDRLEAALAFVRTLQEGRVPQKRSAGAPSRRGEMNHMFGTG